MSKIDTEARRLMPDGPQVFAVQAEGRTVPMTDGSPWPTEGAWVDEDQYVRRRLSDGDLALAAPQTAAEPAPKSASTSRS